MGRRASRDSAMKLLYQLAIKKEYNMEAVEALLDETTNGKTDKEYIESVTRGVIDSISHIDLYIERHLKRWKLERICKVDLSILRLAVFEILFMEDIPESVSINEAIELAKKYSSDESASYINGVLSSILKNRVQEL